jgi:hypothetical protein
MSVRIRRPAALAALVVMLVTSAITLTPDIYAEAAAPQSTTIKTVLEEQAGKRTKVQLLSGQDLEGKVQSVGSEVFVIAELTGMEFFSATVRIDQVAAVIYRAKNP